jgi:hypothetical protein
MHKLLLTFSIISLFIATPVIASNTHKFGLGVNYHLDQDSSPGYQFLYQLQLGDSFEFEARYFDHNDIKLETNTDDIFANYDQFTMGANFIKQYNKQLSIKAGTGLAFVTSSSNEFVIEEQSMTPYLMLAGAYQVSDNLTIEFGQFSHFNDELLSTNHSLYLSMSYSFNNDYSQINIPTQEKNNAKAQQQSQPAQMPTTNAPPINKKVFSNQTITKNNSLSTINELKALWYVQFGAFINESNGQESLIQLKRMYPNISFSFTYHSNYYRIISNNFMTKQRANDYVDLVKLNYGLLGYVTQLTKK